MNAKDKILILNGPNLNFLGTREVDIYGKISLDEIKKYTQEKLKECELEWFQSNSEGELIDQIQGATEKGYHLLVINPGGYTHSSVAIFDALKMVEIPVIEVHLSNTTAREDFRKQRITSQAAKGIIEGFGKDSYFLAVYSYICNKDVK